MSGRLLVAIDLDGTLVGESLVISPQDETAILASSRAGNVICLASGRLFSASRPFAAQLGLRGPIIALQGAAAYDIESEQRLFCIPLAVTTALRAYDELKERGFHLQLYYGDQLYLDTINDAARYYMKISRVEPLVVPDLRALMTGTVPHEPGPIKVLGIASAALVNETISQLAPAFAGRANVFRSLPVFLEVTDPAATKGEALRRLASLLGIGMEATAAIGDSDNDVSMFEAAACSFAVANATEAAKRGAREVVAPLGSGVAEALHRLEQRMAHEPA